MEQVPKKLPQRRKLPHEVPPWVQQGARHFITINCMRRNSKDLLQNDVAHRLLGSAKFYEESNRWYLWLMLIMPDHVHFIATFDLARGIRKTVSAWKGYQKKTLGIEWQSGFFEHRLRNDDEFVEKMSYVRMNPVRKGLAAVPDDWPYVVDRTRLGEDASPYRLGEDASPYRWK